MVALATFSRAWRGPVLGIVNPSRSVPRIFANATVSWTRSCSTLLTRVHSGAVSGGQFLVHLGEPGRVDFGYTWDETANGRCGVLHQP